MPGRKSYAGGAARTTLNGSISNSATTIVVISGTGYPTGGTYPFVITIDRGTVSEEKVLVQSRSGNTLTVAASGRGYDSTTAVSHADSAYVEHTLDADTISEANLHVNDDTRDDHSQYLNTTRHDVTARHGASVVDHGSVGGLSDNDHPQYLLAGDFDKAAVDALAIDAATLDGIDSTGFATVGHTHAFATDTSVAEIIETATGVGIANTNTTIETFSMTLPGGWTSMAVSIEGYATVASALAGDLVRGKLWIDSPSAGTPINTHAALWSLDDSAHPTLGYYVAVPISALVTGLTATTNALLRGIITRGNSSDASVVERYIKLVKHRLS